MTNPIRTISELIEALGGDAAVAEKCNISRQAISNWKLRNNIATGFHLKFYAQAKKLGLNVCPSIFGLDAEDAEILFSHNTVPLMSDALPQNVVRFVANNS